MRSYWYPKGRVQAKGFFYSYDQPLEPFKELVFGLWSCECKLYRVKRGIVILLVEEMPCFVDSLAYAPLIEQNRVISNVLWCGLEHSSEILDENSLWLLHRGEITIEALEPNMRFDPAIWLDVDTYRCVKLKALGELIQPKVVKSEAGVSVRDLMKDQGLEVSPRLKSVLKALDEIKESGSVNHKKSSRSGFRFLAIAKEVVGVPKKLFGAVASAFRGSGTSKSSKSVGQNDSDIVGFFKRVRIALSQLIFASKIGKAIGRAQARYIEKLMGQLGSGNLDEALRNAIPLSNLQDALRSQGPKMGSPKPRNSLQINTHARASSQSISVADTLLGRLRALYEAAFEKLDKAGDYKKAAFILAELLRDIDRAVMYLEKHGQYKLAAELAEGQQLQPARVIRQWILAKDVERAMHIAILSGCYEEAITALGHSHPKEANILRWNIANLHYKAGNLQAAIDIAWPLEARREEIICWLKESYQLGGDIGAKHLVRLAAHDANNHADYLSEIHQALSDATPSASLAVYKEVVKLSADFKNTQIATLVLRAYLRDVAGQKISHEPKIWDKLCKIAGDLTLRADARSLNFDGRLNKICLKDQSAVIESVFDRAYGRRAQDCAVLQSGEMLIAFGESGVELWSSKGRKVKSFAVPCHSIVINDTGTRALLIARRSGYQVISKFSLKNCMVTYWLELRLSCWASSYDGTGWLVGYDDTVMMIDTNSDEKTARWVVNDLGGSLSGLERTPSYFAFCIGSEEHFEIWSYKLPNLYLKERSPYKRESLGAIKPVTYSASGVLAGFNPESPDQFYLYQGKPSGSWATLGFDGEIVNLRLDEQWLLVVAESGDSVFVHIYPVIGGKLNRPVRSLKFFGSTDIKMRIHREKVVVYHGDGRVVVLGLETGAVESDFII
ncbi:bpX6 domain-containing protein [Microbulbifer guangxiensis]|uniref:bpX6 domain-containing protein n=1 Tax=Microbulbifer guangxiensis TaxID=2904249 RepID=UPI001F366996|nr:bpX6 domain-containing protein [Microbulbifer guangxiensis]